VEAFGVASDDYNTIEGAHAKDLGYIFDEAKSIPRTTWNAAEGAFANANVGKKLSDNIESDELEGAGVEDGITSVGRVDIRSKLERTKIRRSHVHSLDLHEMSPLEVLSSTRYHNLPRFPVLDKSIVLPTGLGSEVIDVSPTIIPNIQITDKAFAFAISTPGDPVGQFFDIHMHKPGYDDWLTRHVTVDEAIRAGRISAAWVAQRQKQWGYGSSLFQNRVLGEFADSSEDGIIPRSWVLASCERWKGWKMDGARLPAGRVTIGVDTARQGMDKTICAKQTNFIMPVLYRYSKLTITSLAGYVKALANGAHMNIEMDGGLGASLYDILHEDLVPNLHPITVGAKTTWTDKSKKIKFGNVRAAMWWNMRQLLDPDEGENISLPPNEDLIMDLTAPHMKMSSDSTIFVESKQEIRDRIGRSTDYGDACCLAFWKTSVGGGIIF
jgi:hypothetical protein